MASINSLQQTGAYSKELTKKVTKLERHSKGNKVRRVILFFLLIAVSGSSIFYGIKQKTDFQEARYLEFSKSMDRSSLDSELLAYKDTYEIFVECYLGNDPWQSMMGGFFYTNDLCSISPSPDASKTTITVDGAEHVISGFLADNLNMRENTILYRSPSSRKIYEYDLQTRRTKALQFQNVGQFVVCGEEYYYIDLSQSALIMYNSTNDDFERLVETGVVSFVMVGNDILYLDTFSNLNCYHLTNHTSEVIEENISSFSYNGSLWFQNNSTVYRRELNEDQSKEIELGLACKRLFGVTETCLIFESDNGVYIHDLVQDTNTIIGNDVFVGASEDSYLWYRLSDQEFRITMK